MKKLGGKKPERRSASAVHSDAEQTQAVVPAVASASAFGDGRAEPSSQLWSDQRVLACVRPCKWLRCRPFLARPSRERAAFPGRTVCLTVPCFVAARVMITLAH